MPDLPSCCKFHGFPEGGCREGRACPARRPLLAPIPNAEPYKPTWYDAVIIVSLVGWITFALARILEKT